MHAYIKHSTAISPQESFNQDFPWNELQIYSDKLESIEPIYKEFFPPMKIRRMSRLVKMALTSAKVCLDKSDVDMPEAIITSSGWGCLNDTYKYLGEITNEEITAPSPATFIQSTHNTPGGQIALTLGCQNYNNVIVNGNTSFELALIDALMLLQEGKNNLLVGGFDEIAPTDYELKKQAGYWKEEGLKSDEFIHHNSEGTLPGEGAAFALLSSDSEKCASEIKRCAILNCLPNAANLEKEIVSLLNEESLTLNDIDIVLSGANGNSKIMPLYADLDNTVFARSSVVDYKQLCGEYDTSPAFALWFADSLIKSQQLPVGVCENSKHESINNILIYHYAGEIKHAVTLVSKTSL